MRRVCTFKPRITELLKKLETQTDLSLHSLRCEDVIDALSDRAQVKVRLVQSQYFVFDQAKVKQVFHKGEQQLKLANSNVAVFELLGYLDNIDR